ncbi:MAG: hypothetical protein M3P06_14545 [Acidobacteriota bacterium]|nr:hypothetical protein [Acidobacteriota bacterium]
MTEEVVAIKLTRDEALVFFEFLTRYSDDSGELRIIDQSEQRVLLAGELPSRGASTAPAHRGASWLIKIGVALSAGSFPLGLISWFGRETTNHPGFREQRLPVRYRIVAWSLVAAAVVAFITFAWYSLSRGLTTW